MTKMINTRLRLIINCLVQKRNERYKRDVIFLLYMSKVLPPPPESRVRKGAPHTDVRAGCEVAGIKLYHMDIALSLSLSRCKSIVVVVVVVGEVRVSPGSGKPFVKHPLTAPLFLGLAERESKRAKIRTNDQFIFDPTLLPYSTPLWHTHTRLHCFCIFHHPTPPCSL